MSVKASTPSVQGISGSTPVMTIDAFGNTVLPQSDIIPLSATTAIITKVNSDGTLGSYAKTFPKFLIGFEANTTRETEDLETGDGADIPRAISEAVNVDMTVNAYNAVLHSMLTGKDVVTGVMAVREMGTMVIVEGGTDPDFTYTYTFPTESKPVEENTGKGDYGIVIYDVLGREFQDATTSLDPLGKGQYKYDPTAGTITVSSEYKGKTLSVLYFKQVTDGFRMEMSDIIKTNTFKVECLSIVQSASTGLIYMRRQVISRAVLNGDAPELPVQKAINTNMVYPLVSTTPAPGEKKYTETFSVYTS